MRLSFLLIATAAAGVWSMAEAQKCYTSTLEIFVDQVSPPFPKEFIVCPNTYIKVGIPNEYNNDFNDGSWPLLPIGPDVTFKCGLSGKSENNCTLDSKSMHFLSLPEIPSVGRYDIKTDNLYVSGFTFTGDGTKEWAQRDSFSVTINAPGKNQTFNDIIWKDAKYETFFQAVELDIVPDALLPDLSIEVTLQNSKFHNIKYGSAVLNVAKQSLTVRNTSFDEVKAYDCLPECTPFFVSAFTGFSNSTKWTSTNDTYIALIDNCFQGVEASSALITTRVHGTAKVILNKENNYVKDMTLLSDLPDENVCKKGIAILKADERGDELEKCKKFADAKTCSLSDTNKGSKSGKSASNKGGKSGKSGKSASYKGSKSDADKKSRI